MIFLFTVVLSCSIRSYRLPERQTLVTHEIPIPVIQENLVVAPVPLQIQDTTTDTVPTIETHIVHQIDTSALRFWMYDFAEHQRREWLEEKEIHGIFDKWERSLDESEAVVWQLVKALEDKEKAEQTALIAQNVVFDVPTAFFFTGVFFAFCFSLIIYKQHYSRVKLEKQIANLKSCRTD